VNQKTKEQTMTTAPMETTTGTTGTEGTVVPATTASATVVTVANPVTPATGPTEAKTVDLEDDGFVTVWPKV